MAGSLNKVVLIGNVGRAPEQRYLPGGEAITTFSVATNRRWTGTDGIPHDEAEWHAIVTWGKLAEQCHQSLTKGSKVFIEGRLRTRSWDGPDGQKRYRTEIVAHTMVLLSQGLAGGDASRREEVSSALPEEPA